jgi:methyl-accepting chemotaxis protein
MFTSISKRLGRLGVAVKVGVLVAGSTAVAVTAVSYIAASGTTDIVTASQEDRIQGEVETAFGVLEHFAGLESEGVLSTEDAQAQALATIEHLRFNDGLGYFWVNDHEPTMVMHPIKPELNGAFLGETVDPNGFDLFNAMVAVVEADGGGFVEYVWPNPQTEMDEEKISYVAGFDQWDWIIGTGVYRSEISGPVADTQSALLRRVILTALGVGAVAVALATLVVRKLMAPVREVQKMVTTVAEKDLASVDAAAEAVASGDDSAQG